jgi:hypothetical protein
LKQKELDFLSENILINIEELDSKINFLNKFNKKILKYNKKITHNKLNNENNDINKLNNFIKYIYKNINITKE